MWQAVGATLIECGFKIVAVSLTSAESLESVSILAEAHG